MPGPLWAKPFGTHVAVGRPHGLCLVWLLGRYERRRDTDLPTDGVNAGVNAGVNICVTVGVDL